MNFYEWFFLEKDREPVGLFSFGHLFTVTLTLAIMIGLAIFLGKKFKDDAKRQKIVLIVSAIIVVGLTIAKEIVLLIQTDNIVDCLIGNAPLFFCDAVLYIIPLAVLTKGRFRDWCLDFLAICGLLMGFMGNYFAGNLYPSHALISWAVMVGLLTHSIAAFVSMFIWVARMNKMEKRDIPFVIGLLFVYMTIALVLAYAFNKNYMFFFHGDGTPYSFFEGLIGNTIIYQIFIYVLQCGYMGAFYGVYFLVNRLIEKRRVKKQEQVIVESEN